MLASHQIITNRGYSSRALVPPTDPPTNPPTHLDVSSVVHENVLGLDVSVDNAMLMQVDKALQHLPGVLAGHGVAQGAELVEQGVKGTRGDPLLENAQPPLAVLQLRAQVADNVRVHKLVHHLHTSKAHVC